MIEPVIRYVVDVPVFVFAATFVLLWLSARLGDFFRQRRPLQEAERQDFGLVLTACLTLLGLIIGFSFSMAVSRFDQRKTYEEAEANAIGTEYLRADLLPAADAARVRELLAKYIEQRVAFYKSRDKRQLEQIRASFTGLQSELWSTVRAASAAQPTPVLALAVSGMNDVLNSEGYTKAAWTNRIPIEAWGLMAAIAVCCNMLFGYVSHKPAGLLFVVLPLAASISSFLIADIDSPRGGVIRVPPENLLRLSQSLNSSRPEAHGATAAPQAPEASEQAR